MNVAKTLVFVSLLLLVFLQVGKAFADDTLLSPTTIPLTPTPTPIDYNLPYPGLLPDNPFYILKIFRDRAVGFLISNPLKRAQFDLLQSDKRVQGAYLLVVQENKMDLAEMTFSKGENYFDEAIANASDAKKQGIDVTEFTRTLTIANSKHLEIVTLLKEKAPEKYKHKFANIQQKIRDLGKKVKTLSKK